MDKMQDGFEKWISSFIGKSWLEKSKDDLDDYKDDNTQFMWEAWQASRAALCVELPDNLDGEYYADGWNACLIAVGEKIEEAGVSCK